MVALVANCVIGRMKHASQFVDNDFLGWYFEDGWTDRGFRA